MRKNRWKAFRVIHSQRFCAIDRNERAWIYSYNVKCSFSDYIWLVHKAFSFKAFNLTRFVANNNNKASSWQQRRKWLNVLRWRYETFYANEKKYASKKLQEIERILFYYHVAEPHFSRKSFFMYTYLCVCM